MADKKDSELTVKGAIVDGDKIPLLDSETAIAAEQNKTVLASTLKSYAGGPTEGSWTPSVSSLTVTNPQGYYQVTGDMVTLLFSFTMPTTAGAFLFGINDLPFTSATAGIVAYHGLISARFAGALLINDRLELGASQSSMGAVSDAAPTGRPVSYYSDHDIYGSITYIKA